jgi:hypothetical protein
VVVQDSGGTLKCNRSLEAAGVDYAPKRDGDDTMQGEFGVGREDLGC